MTRIVAWAAGAAALLASGVYSVIYLARWEWSRALWTTTLFVAVEVALVGALLLNRLRRLDRRLDRLDQAATATRMQRRLTASRPPHPARFAWLAEQQGRTNVFITMAMGGGLVVSGLAWVADRVGSVTSTPSRERRLAEELTSLALPDTPFVQDDMTLLAADVPGVGADGLRLLVGDSAALRSPGGDR